MSLTVKSRSKSLKDVELKKSETESLKSVLKGISEKNRGISKHRLRVTYEKGGKQVAIVEDKVLKDEISKNGADFVLFVKDLGPQISWRLTFLIEYIGPIIVHTILYRLSLNESVASRLQNAYVAPNPIYNRILYYMIVAHYAKREFESVFVHKFSNATMPVFNVFKNSFHYWILNGSIGLAYFGHGFLFSDRTIDHYFSKFHLSSLPLLIALFTISELWNLYVHVKLRLWGDEQKRLGNTKVRVPINDGVFSAFVAPNYSFEVYSWFWFTMVCKLNIFALIFLTVSTVQMYIWAQKKNQKYKTRRAFFIPYIF